MADPVLKSEGIAKKLHGAFCRDVSRQALLQLAADLVQRSGAPYTSAYMYMLDDAKQALHLEAYSGRETEHKDIPVGKGLCGRAVREKTDLNISDVTADSDYLACNLDTRSELIVLIRRHEEILGQIDIDSDVPSGFDATEETALREVADALASLL